MSDELKPSKSEIEFLTLAYNRFYDIYDEAMSKSFWNKDAYYRFSVIKDAFSVYSEILNYEPLKWEVERVKKTRPPMEAEIQKELFKFIRNLFSHFPFYCSWDEVWINKSIANWYREGLSIDRFLKKYAGTDFVKYRMLDRKNDEWLYTTINFPNKYDESVKIYLNEIMKESEGVIFSLVMMRKLIDTQVESVK